MIEALIVLIVVGVCLWLVETQIPLSPPVRVVIRVVVVLALFLFLLDWFGLVDVSWRGMGH